jgi:hypothetical protein
MPGLLSLEYNRTPLLTKAYGLFHTMKLCAYESARKNKFDAIAPQTQLNKSTNLRGPSHGPWAAEWREALVRAPADG